LKNARLIIGIVSFILFFIILFQSCAAGFVNSVNASSDAGGSAGLVVAFMVVIAGIIAIVCAKTQRAPSSQALFMACLVC